MLANAVPSLLQHVRHLAATATSDEQLLDDFVARRSSEAFAALLGRHGPMVLNVCRRVLHDPHTAEDVFQATFLVLAGRAWAIRRRASLAGFLHGVAYRLAVRARRRKTQSLPEAVCDKSATPADGLAWKEALGILDHELGLLPDRLRAPLVLCYLEGRTQDEAAQQLCLSLSTLRRRLARGRQLLEARLRGRGVTLSAALAGLLTASVAAVPGRLRATTLAATIPPAVGALTVSASALALVRKGVGLFLATSGKKVGALVAVSALVTAACFAFCWAPHADQTAAGEPTRGAAAGRGDPKDDALPARGVVRLGTARYRHGSRIECLAVSPDAKLAATGGEWSSFAPARVFDLTDGRCLYNIPFEPGSTIEAVALSPDGKTLAVRHAAGLSLRDAATGKEFRKVTFAPTGVRRTITDWLTFTPDGKHLAATSGGSAVHLIDVATGSVDRTFEHDDAVSACVFSPDGKLMAAGGYESDKGVYFARLWEVGTGKEPRRFAAGDGRFQSLAFSPDGATLAAGGGDARLRLWEVAGGKELKVFPKIGHRIKSVAFAPDGKTVAVAGDAVHLYDVGTGKERLRIERRARGLSFSPDGSILTGAVSGAIYRWDAASGRQLTPSVAHDSAVDQILVSPDGRRVYTRDQDGDLHAWDVVGGKPPRRIVGGVERGVVASPDGRFLAWTVEDDSVRTSGTDGIHRGSRVLLYDVSADRVIDQFPAVKDDASVHTFLADGKTVLTLDRETATVRLWDVESGKERRAFPAAPESPGGLPYSAGRAALSPDGKQLAVSYDRADNVSIMYRGVPVRTWDVATGKPGHDLGGHVNSVDGLAFSPDGRLLVTWAENPMGGGMMDRVSLWDAATGKHVPTLDSGLPIGAGSAAFSPDGRTLATASRDGKVRLWEVATWTVRAEFDGHRDRVTALAFGPDGRLYTGGHDTVVLGWDVRPPGEYEGTLADAWEALAKSDAKPAFRAQGRFLAEPGKAVEWLATRVTPAAPLDPARLKALIADLDHDDFATRERATASLKEQGRRAADALREVMAKSSSAEARRRAEGILEEGEKTVTPPGELRILRAAEVLEWLATKEARAILLGLAKGSPDAPLTRESAAACKRLEARE